MKTQQQAQAIYDTLITNLQSANYYGLYYVTRNISGCRPDIQNPLEKFLTSMQEELAPADFHRDFLSQVYAEAFHTGDIPKNRNHIAMTCDLTLLSQLTSPLLKFWIDLDKVAALTNTHFHINPHYRFNVEYNEISSSCSDAYSGGVPLTKQTSSAVNSVYNSYKITTYFLMGCICSGIISGFALLIAALAVASILALSTVGICTAVGISVLAGVASYGLFKSTYVTTATVFNESNPENIVDIFQQHFASTISAPDGGILPQDRVEIIDEQALRILFG